MARILLLLSVCQFLQSLLSIDNKGLNCASSLLDSFHLMPLHVRNVLLYVVDSPGETQ